MIKNDPNRNFAAYEADREAKRKAQSTDGEQAQYTTGPWEWDEDTFSLWHEGEEIIHLEGNSMAAEANFQANARLISAAPELLAACKRLVAMSRNFGVDELKTALVAIDKAEGRAS